MIFHSIPICQKPSLYKLHRRVRDLHDKYVAHNIFLSHSGAQKAFAQDLYDQLRAQKFSTFFDKERHSLPLGEHFPNRILQAAKGCEVAVVVLSEEFLCSKWPMIELCAFVDYGVKLLPLFLRVSPADLKDQKNLESWRKTWTELAEQDSRIIVSKWENAVKKLCSQNGIELKACEQEQAYIDKIVFEISGIVLPVFMYDTTQIMGKDRLCKVILDRFESMAQYSQSRGVDASSSPESASTSSNQEVTSVLGLYGLPGSGKTTLCKCLLDHYRPFFGSINTLYLDFPSSPSPEVVVNKLKLLLSLTDFRDRVDLHGTSDIEYVISLLKSFGLSTRRVLLVVDNISDKSWQQVHRILHLGFAPGSKLILVAHTFDVLRPTLVSLKHVLHWACGSMSVPSINEAEAAEILLSTATGSYAASNKDSLVKGLTRRQKKIVEHILQMCGKVWLPLVMKAVGARLLKYEKGDWKESRHMNRVL